MTNALGGITCEFSGHVDGYDELVVKDALALGRIVKWLLSL